MLLGAGIGLMFKSGGASGGWSVLARIIAEKVKMKVGKVTIALDCIVLILLLWFLPISKHFFMVLSV